MDGPRLAQSGKAPEDKGRRTHDDPRVRAAKSDRGWGQIAIPGSRKPLKKEELVKPLPSSVPAERAILGAVLLDNNAYREAAESLSPGDFSLDSHRRIYARMADLAESSRAIDLVTLGEELVRYNDLQRVGGDPYLSGLLDGVPDRPSIKSYIRIVKNKTLLRGLILALEDIIERSYDGAQPAEEVVSLARTKIDALGDGHARASREGHITAWGQIPMLDNLPVGEVSWAVDGMIPAGGVVLWAGESGSYKTWLSLCLSRSVHEGSDFLGRRTTPMAVLYLDRENPAPLVRERCALLRIPSSEDFRIWGGWHSDAPPLIGDRRLLEIARNSKPLIVVDSFIRFHAADENSATEMGRVMAEVRALANAGATVVLQHHKPKAEGTQYRGSSDIKAGVDVAFAVICHKEQNSVTVQCFKNRYGGEFAITARPSLEDGTGFEVTRDLALQREHGEKALVLKIVREQPGINQGQVVKRAGLSLHRTRAILEAGLGVVWRTEQGPRGRLDYYCIDEEASVSAFQPSSSEMLKSLKDGFFDTERVPA